MSGKEYFDLFASPYRSYSAYKPSCSGPPCIRQHAARLTPWRLPRSADATKWTRCVFSFASLADQIIDFVPFRPMHPAACLSFTAPVIRLSSLKHHPAALIHSSAQTTEAGSPANLLGPISSFHPASLMVPLPPKSAPSKTGTSHPPHSSPCTPVGYPSPQYSAHRSKPPHPPSAFPAPPSSPLDRRHNSHRGCRP